MFTRYIVKQYPAWKKVWGIWDRLDEAWISIEISRHEAQKKVVLLNAR